MMKAYIDTNVPASQYEYSSSLIKFLSPSGTALMSGAAFMFYYLFMEKFAATHGHSCVPSVASEQSRARVAPKSNVPSQSS